MNAYSAVRQSIVLMGLIASPQLANAQYFVPHVHFNAGHRYSPLEQVEAQDRLFELNRKRMEFRDQRRREKQAQGRARMQETVRVNQELRERRLQQATTVLKVSLDTNGRFQPWPDDFAFRYGDEIEHLESAVAHGFSPGQSHPSVSDRQRIITAASRLKQALAVDVLVGRVGTLEYAEVNRRISAIKLLAAQRRAPTDLPQTELARDGE